jgi:hypothetical protein
MLFISQKVWSEIRWQFNEAEKRMLRLRILNNVICPPGVDVDVDRLAPELREKIVAAVHEANPAVKKGA